MNIREAHERPEAMEETSVMMVGMNKERVIQALSVVEKQNKGEVCDFRLENDYSIPNVSDKIVRKNLSNVDYVNHVVWSK
jgi:UDP-N-acetylglucosamine 2-epimerase